jgi:hypothetical protein
MRMLRRWAWAAWLYVFEDVRKTRENEHQDPEPPVEPGSGVPPESV